MTSASNAFDPQQSPWSKAHGQMDPSQAMASSDIDSPAEGCCSPSGQQLQTGDNQAGPSTLVEGCCASTSASNTLGASHSENGSVQYLDKLELDFAEAVLAMELALVQCNARRRREASSGANSTAPQAQPEDSNSPGTTDSTDAAPGPAPAALPPTAAVSPAAVPAQTPRVRSTPRREPTEILGVVDGGHAMHAAFARRAANDESVSSLEDLDLTRILLAESPAAVSSLTSRSGPSQATNGAIVAPHVAVSNENSLLLSDFVELHTAHLSLVEALTHAGIAADFVNGNWRINTDGVVQQRAPKSTDADRVPPHYHSTFAVQTKAPSPVPSGIVPAATRLANGNCGPYPSADSSGGAGAPELCKSLDVTESHLNNVHDRILQLLSSAAELVMQTKAAALAAHAPAASAHSATAGAAAVQDAPPASVPQVNVAVDSGALAPSPAGAEIGASSSASVVEAPPVLPDGPQRHLRSFQSTSALPSKSSVDKSDLPRANGASHSSALTAVLKDSAPSKRGRSTLTRRTVTFCNLADCTAGVLRDWDGQNNEESPRTRIAARYRAQVPLPHLDVANNSAPCNLSPQTSGSEDKLTSEQAADPTEAQPRTESEQPSAQGAENTLLFAAPPASDDEAAQDEQQQSHTGSETDSATWGSLGLDFADQQHAPQSAVDARRVSRSCPGAQSERSSTDSAALSAMHEIFALHAQRIKQLEASCEAIHASLQRVEQLDAESAGHAATGDANMTRALAHIGSVLRNAIMGPCSEANGAAAVSAQAGTAADSMLGNEIAADAVPGLLVETCPDGCTDVVQGHASAACGVQAVPLQRPDAERTSATSVQADAGALSDSSEIVHLLLKMLHADLAWERDRMRRYEAAALANDASQKELWQQLLLEAATKEFMQLWLNKHPAGVAAPPALRRISQQPANHSSQQRPVEDDGDASSQCASSHSSDMPDCCKRQLEILERRARAALERDLQDALISARKTTSAPAIAPGPERDGPTAHMLDGVLDGSGDVQGELQAIQCEPHACVCNAADAVAAIKSELAAANAAAAVREAALEATIAALEAEKTDLTRELSALRTRCDELTALEATIAALEAEKSGLTHELSALRVRCDELARSGVKKADELARSGVKKAELLREVEALRATRAEFRKRVSGSDNGVRRSTADGQASANANALDLDPLAAQVAALEGSVAAKLADMASISAALMQAESLLLDLGGVADRMCCAHMDAAAHIGRSVNDEGPGSARGDCPSHALLGSPQRVLPPVRPCNVEASSDGMPASKGESDIGEFMWTPPPNVTHLPPRPMQRAAAAFEDDGHLLSGLIINRGRLATDTDEGAHSNKQGVHSAALAAVCHCLQEAMLMFVCESGPSSKTERPSPSSLNRQLTDMLVCLFRHISNASSAAGWLDARTPLSARDNEGWATSGSSRGAYDVQHLVTVVSRLRGALTEQIAELSEGANAATLQLLHQVRAETETALQAIGDCGSTLSVSTASTSAETGGSSERVAQTSGSVAAAEPPGSPLTCWRPHPAFSATPRAAATYVRLVEAECQSLARITLGLILDQQEGALLEAVNTVVSRCS